MKIGGETIKEYTYVRKLKYNGSVVQSMTFTPSGGGSSSPVKSVYYGSDLVFGTIETISSTPIQYAFNEVNFLVTVKSFVNNPHASQVNYEGKIEGMTVNGQTLPSPNKITSTRSNNNQKLHFPDIVNDDNTINFSATLIEGDFNIDFNDNTIKKYYMSYQVLVTCGEERVCSSKIIDVPVESNSSGYLQYNFNIRNSSYWIEYLSQSQSSIITVELKVAICENDYGRNMPSGFFDGYEDTQL